MLAHEDVFRNVKMRKQFGILVDSHDPRIARRQRRRINHWRAVQPYFAEIGGLNAGDDLYGRRLARAVFSEDCVNLTGGNLETDVHQRPNAAKTLAHPVERKSRRRDSCRDHRGSSGTGAAGSRSPSLRRSSQTVAGIRTCISATFAATSLGETAPGTIDAMRAWPRGN